MAIPDIASYLAATRQPLDLVGPAISAFQAVSAEMRATRAQNQSEEESARDLGKGIKEGMQKDRMFQEGLIDKAQLRQIRAEDQDFERQRLGFEQQRLGMDLARHQFAQDNLWQLELQQKQMDLLQDKQFYDARALEIQNQRGLTLLGRENLNRLAGVIDGTVPVEEDAIDREAGEDENSPLARLRMAHAMFNRLGPQEVNGYKVPGFVDIVDSPAIKAMHAMMGMKIQADPDYASALASGKLTLPSERKENVTRLQNLLRAQLPGNDDWADAFLAGKQKTFKAMERMSPEDALTTANSLLAQARSEMEDPGKRAAKDAASIQSAALDLIELWGQRDSFPQDGNPDTLDEINSKIGGAEQVYRALSLFTGMDPLSKYDALSPVPAPPAVPAVPGLKPAPSALGSEMKSLILGE